MTIEDRLGALACHVRGDTPPAVDVSDRVVWILRSPSPHSAYLPERIWMWMAGLSCVAAAAVVTVAVPFWLSGIWNDPFVEVVETISWVIQ